MADINRTTYFYRHKFKAKAEEFNKPMPLPDYFDPMIGDKKSVTIAEIGAGPVNTIGNYKEGVEVKIYASDVMQPEYEKFRKYHNVELLVPIEYQDFEHLTYPDEFFDIVHCVNAVDHTEDACKAILEMFRVCKKGGWVYLRHAPNQMDRYGGMHRWNVSYLDKDRCLFQSKDSNFILEAPTHMEGDLIVSVCQKT